MGRGSTPLPYLCEKGVKINMRKKDEMQSRIIKRQKEEINRLKDEIASLKYECQAKDEMLEYFDDARHDIKSVIDGMSESRDGYVEAVKELREMKRVINQEVFNGRWWLIKLIIKKFDIKLR